MSLASQISALATRVGQEVKALYQGLAVKAKGEHGIYYIEGNTTGTAGSWTGSHAGITSLYVGLTVAYRIGIAGAGTTTLNINGLGANTVRRCNANLTTHLPTATVVLLTFDGAYWVWADYTDGNNYDRMYWGNAVIAGAAIYSYKLLMQGPDGKFYPLTLETGTGTSKTVSQQEFVLGSPILHYATTATVASGAALSNVYSEYPMTTLGYTANQASWTANLPIYLRGTVLASGNFRLDNTSYTSFMTQTLPATEDGFVYILLGHMYGATYLRLFQHHPVYQFKNGRVRLYESDDPRPITKAMVEGVLTGNISSHTHSYQPYNYDLSLIAALTGTSGILRKNGVGNWNLDTTVYEPRLDDSAGFGIPVLYGTSRLKTDIVDFLDYFRLSRKNSISALDIDWSSGAIFTKTLSANSTFTFSNLMLNKTITLVLSGNYTVTLPAYCKRISGTYDGSTANYIQLHCTDEQSGTEEVWFTISKQAV